MLIDDELTMYKVRGNLNKEAMDEKTLNVIEKIFRD